MQVNTINAVNILFHRNNKFEDLVSLLEKQKVIKLEVKGKNKKVIIVDKTHFNSIFNTIFLFYSLIPEDIPVIVLNEEPSLNIGLKLRFRTLYIPIEDSSLHFLRSFLNPEEFTENSDWYKVIEELFNSFVILTIASMYFSEIAYPNTYVTEFKNEHEIDGVLKFAGCYLFIETTFGRKVRDLKTDRIEDEEKVSEHLRKKLFYKWFLEKVYDKKIYFLYINTHCLPETKTLSYLAKMEDFRSICLLKDENLHMGKMRKAFFEFHRTLKVTLKEWFGGGRPC